MKLRTLFSKSLRSRLEALEREVDFYKLRSENSRELETKAKQLSEKYLNTLNDLNKAQALSGTGSWKWYINENRVEWSEQMYHIFGIDRDNFNGDLQEVINARIHPEDRERVFDSNKSVAETGKPDSIDYRLLMPDGTTKIVWAEGGEIVPDSEGRPAVLTGVVQDITEYRTLYSDLLRAKEIAEEKENKYRMFIDQTTEGISLFEVIPPVKTDLPVEDLVDYLYENTILTECNNSFMAMYGVSDIKDLLGKSLLDFHGGKNNEQNRNEIRQFVKGKFRAENAETHEKNSKGELRYFSNTSIGIVQDGLLTRVWGTQIDITSLREKEKELLMAKEKTEESDRLKTAFLNNMSHEVRTPLNGIVGFSKLLSMPDLTDDKRAEYSDIVAKSSEKLIEIMSDLTEISKIHVREVNVFPEKFDLQPVVSEIIDSYSKTLSRKNLKVRVQGPESRIIIFSDPGKVRKMLSHIIDNAVKFTKKGSISIEYITENEKVSIIVEDTGPGIPSDKTEIIFEPFRQLTPSEGGNGLGLSIVKAYTEALHGSICIDSVINRGTKIILSFPVDFSKNMIAQTSFNNEHFRFSHKKTFAARKILIAEDEYINFLYLKEILQSDRLEIIHALNGKEAVEICSKDDDIDLVLMDLMMPEMDGSSAAKIIRTIKPDLPIILQTAYSFDNEVTGDGLFDDYIAKPIKLDILRTKLSRFVCL
jgi:signal transduction histidine kinase